MHFSYFAHLYSSLKQNLRGREFWPTWASKPPVYWAPFNRYPHAAPQYQSLIKTEPLPAATQAQHTAQDRVPALLPAERTAAALAAVHTAVAALGPVPVSGQVADSSEPTVH
jgi:hypothetical protein